MKALRTKNQNILNKAIKQYWCRHLRPKWPKPAKLSHVWQIYLSICKTIAKFLQAQIILSPYSIRVRDTLGRIPMNQTQSFITIGQFYKIKKWINFMMIWSKCQYNICKKNVEAPLQGLDTLILHPLFYWEYVAIREEKEGKRYIDTYHAKHLTVIVFCDRGVPVFFTIQSYPIILYKKMW